MVTEDNTGPHVLPSHRHLHTRRRTRKHMEPGRTCMHSAVTHVPPDRHPRSQEARQCVWNWGKGTGVMGTHPSTLGRAHSTAHHGE